MDDPAVFAARRPSENPEAETGGSIGFPHTHNAYEVLFVTGGQARVTVGGRPYTAAAGSVVFISRLEVHRVDALDDDYTRYYATVSHETLQRLPVGSRLTRIFENRPLGFGHCLDFRPHIAAIEPLFAAMVRECRQPGVFSDDMLRLLLSELLILFCRLKPEAFPVTFSRAAELTEKAKQYIKEHFDEDLSLDEVAAPLLISAGYLTHIFKQETGYSPTKYLRLCRLAEARALLVHSRLDITDIAFRVGFSDIGSFNNYFKAQTGQTPRQYRMNNSGDPSGRNLNAGKG